MPKWSTFWELVNLRFLTIKSKNSRLQNLLLTRSRIHEITERFSDFNPKLGTFWDLVNLRFLTIKSKK